MERLIDSWFPSTQGYQEHCIGSQPISGRLITTRLSAIPFNITVIQAYALIMHYNDEVIEDFYNQVQDVLNKAPKKGVIIL